MKILFYIEPLIELGKPFWRFDWLADFSRGLIEAMGRFSEPPDEIGIVIRYPFARRYSLPGVRTFVFTQNEMLDQRRYHYHDLTINWHRGTYSPEVRDYYVRLFQNKLEDFVPDIIITYTPVPFLQTLFPNALVLHTEVAMFTRAPYPWTHFFDPLGMGFGKYPTDFWPHLSEALHFGDQERAILEKFVNRCREIILAKSPFRPLCNTFRERFKRLVLLPLQVSGNYLFDSYVHYRSQYDYLIDVLEQVPRDIGVLVTTHPDFPELSEEVVDYCRMKYPHFIHDDAFRDYYASSQYLIAEVDAVINVSSLTGLGVLFWDKKLIALGKDFFPIIADGYSLAELPDVLSTPLRDKSAVLYWLLTHYVVPLWKYNEPRWLEKFLKRGLEFHRNRGIDAEFYAPINDDCASIFSEWSASLNENIPVPSQYSINRREIAEQRAQSVRLQAQCSELQARCAELDRLQGQYIELQGQYDKMVNRLGWRILTEFGKLPGVPRIKRLLRPLANRMLKIIRYLNNN